MAIYSDAFSQANENPLSSSGVWSGGYGTRPSLQVVSNKVRNATAVGATGTMTYNALTPVDSFAQITIVTLVSGSAVGVLLRYAAPPTENGYRIIATATGTSVNRINDDIDLANDATAWVAGDILRVKINGAWIDVYRNGVRIPALTAHDKTNASGRVGMLVNCNVTLTDAEIDNFIGGDMMSVNSGQSDFLCMY